MRDIEHLKNVFLFEAFYCRPFVIICDKGYHTYCFKPKMENIPDGDW